VKQALDFFERVTGRLRVGGVLEAVHQAARYQAKTNLFQRLVGRAQLGDDLPALAALGQHGL